MAERDCFLAEPTHENSRGEDGPILPTCGFSRVIIGPFLRGKIRRVLHRTRLNKTRTFRISGTFRLNKNSP